MLAAQYALHNYFRKQINGICKHKETGMSSDIALYDLIGVKQYHTHKAYTNLTPTLSYCIPVALCLKERAI